MAPISAAERARIYREKHKNDEQKKESNKKKCKEYRQKLTGVAKQRERRMAALRMRKLRERKKEYELIEDPSDKHNSQASGSDTKSPFATRQALGKAFKRVVKNLPDSSQKRQFVAAKVASIAGVAVQSPKTPKAYFALSVDVKNRVLAFYKRDDISRQLPGRKDIVRIKNPQTGNKDVFNKRLMNFNLREAFTIYKEENPNDTIGISKFCSLRPKEVGIVSSKSQEVCCCPYCENMKFLFDASKWKADAKITQISHLVAAMVCDPENHGCMKCQCKDCPRATDMSDTLRDMMDDEQSEILVEQWNGSS